MIKNITNCLILCCLLVGTACGGGSDGPDKTKPEADIKVPSANQTFVKGANLPLDAVFTDNKALKNCVVTLVYNPDVTSAQLKGLSDPWEPAPATIPLNGKQTDEQKLDNIFAEPVESSCLSGDYTLTFIVEDAAGNKSDAIMVDIVIQ
ncbi:DUF4625 domain-containing protein [Carboxylicivirga taeanensis]|uniref:DUF4625 domain-containing protein n=1 Tax=Carboxylicivirga taeanensis TaxID=1416875 RepID=UPI003F6DCA67